MAHLWWIFPWNMVIFHSCVSHCQRVNAHQIPLNHHFPMIFLWFSRGLMRVGSYHFQGIHGTGPRPWHHGSGPPDVSSHIYHVHLDLEISQKEERRYPTMDGLWWRIRLNWMIWVMYTLVILHSHGIDGTFIDDCPMNTFISKGFSMLILDNQMVVSHKTSDRTFVIRMYYED